MINVVAITGRLTKDPELKYLQSGVAACRFIVAVNRSFTNANGEREADFVNCVAWRKQAESVANFLKKGSLVGIEGRIQTSNFEGKDGNRVFMTEVVANSVQFLEPKNANDGQQNANAQYNTPGDSQNASYNQPYTNTPNYNQNENRGGYVPNNGIQNNAAQNEPFTGGGQAVVSDDDLPF